MTHCRDMISLLMIAKPGTSVHADSQIWSFEVRENYQQKECGVICTLIWCVIKYHEKEIEQSNDGWYYYFNTAKHGLGICQNHLLGKFLQIEGEWPSHTHDQGLLKVADKCQAVNEEFDELGLQHNMFLGADLSIKLEHSWINLPEIYKD